MRKYICWGGKDYYPQNNLYECYIYYIMAPPIGFCVLCWIVSVSFGFGIVLFVPIGLMYIALYTLLGLVLAVLDYFLLEKIEDNGKGLSERGQALVKWLHSMIWFANPPDPDARFPECLEYIVLLLALSPFVVFQLVAY